MRQEMNTYYDGTIAAVPVWVARGKSLGHVAYLLCLYERLDLFWGTGLRSNAGFDFFIPIHG